MKKILKVRIGRSVGGGKTSYTYPPEYDPKKFQVIVYETQIEWEKAKVEARGNKDEYVVGVVEELDAPAFLISDDIVEITRAESETFIGPELNRTSEKITDPSKVLSILAKVARKEVLTPEEENAIDPTNSVKGINNGSTIKDALDVYGV